MSRTSSRCRDEGGDGPQRGDRRLHRCGLFMCRAGPLSPVFPGTGLGVGALLSCPPVGYSSFSSWSAHPRVSHCSPADPDSPQFCSQAIDLRPSAQQAWMPACPRKKPCVLTGSLHTALGSTQRPSIRPQHPVADPPRAAALLTSGLAQTLEFLLLCLTHQYPRLDTLIHSPSLCWLPIYGLLVPMTPPRLSSGLGFGVPGVRPAGL